MKYTFTYEPYARALYPALSDDAFYITMEASVNGEDPSPSDAMRRYMDYSMVEAKIYGRLCLPEGATYGASIWSIPLDPEKEKKKSHEKEAFIKNFMGMDSFSVYQSIVDFMSEKTRQVVDNDAWYLSIIGLDPGCQGKGLGRSLMDPILEMADKQNKSTYLETFVPRNMSFYSRIGYKAAATFFEPETQAEYTVMIREPAS